MLKRSVFFCGHILTPDVFTQGDFVWLDSSTEVPIGAEVTVTDTGQLQLLDDDGKVRGQPPPPEREHSRSA